MQYFYKNVSADLHNKNFYAECTSCRERKYADKLPVFCRSRKTAEKLSAGTGGVCRQKIYNRKKTLAVVHLAIYFNQCSRCGRWVCDSCYTTNVEDGICLECLKKDGKTP